MAKEQWKPVVEYEEFYEISCRGRVRSKYTNIILKQETHYHGYKRVCLVKNGKKKNHYIHRLVAIAFIPNPHDHLIVNHINLKKHHNYLENLEWCSPSDNTQHYYNDKNNPAANIPF